MTKKMNRFRDLLLDNKILLIVVIGMCLAVFLTAWRALLRCATGSIRTAYDAYWEYWEGTDMTAKGVLTNDYGTYLFDEDNRTLLAGPFAGIAACALQRPYREDRRSGIGLGTGRERLRLDQERDGR